MSDKTDRMGAEAFTEWLNYWRGSAAVSAAVAARDTYRERVALEAAAERYERWVTEHDGTPSAGARAAIMGASRFAVGQLVRTKHSHNLYSWLSSWLSHQMEHGEYEPVKAHIDAEGRVIVDEP